ncbi:hypothetical protein SBOR_5344 [Sclerotinia borealis F-4128]|uniref:Uncharacterized protein n=1 Tax=Sclerotinia borealis (strain F-4128) TaxID=1432307 RepID=W9CEJ2_SCLBF|nr:hypothetical protein SBOR_5344 [Sclerotinia borealis F-4128]
MQTASDGSDVHSSIKEIIGSCGSLRKAIDNHANAISAHQLTLLMLVESIKIGTPSASVVGNTTSTQLSTPDPKKIVPGPRRRVRSGVTVTDPITPIQEDAPEDTPQNDPKDEKETPTPSVAPSVRNPKVRRVRRVVSSAEPPQSDAGTEYTTDLPTGDSKTKEIRVEEATHVRSFAEWCKSAIPDDPVFSEILFTSAEDLTIHNELCKNVLVYIRDRKIQDIQYDAYEELRSSHSESSEWATENILNKK